MRTRTRLLQLATTLVAVAVGAHLLMHLDPAGHTAGGHDGEAAGRRLVATEAQGVLTALPDDGAAEEGRGHLMATLCLAVLAAVALTRALLHPRPVRRLAGGRDHGGRAADLPPPPPRPPDRVDAGVVLLV